MPLFCFCLAIHAVRDKARSTPKHLKSRCPTSACGPQLSLNKQACTFMQHGFDAVFCPRTHGQQGLVRLCQGRLRKAGWSKNWVERPPVHRSIFGRASGYCRSWRKRQRGEEGGEAQEAAFLNLHLFFMTVPARMAKEFTCRCKVKAFKV